MCMGIHARKGLLMEHRTGAFRIVVVGTDSCAYSVWRGTPKQEVGLPWEEAVTRTETMNARAEGLDIGTRYAPTLITAGHTR
jgi:hypothetical protein